MLLEEENIYIMKLPHLQETTAKTRHVHHVARIPGLIKRARNFEAGRKTMAAYIARNDKTVLPSSCEDGKLSKTQRVTHSEILGTEFHIPFLILRA